MVTKERDGQAFEVKVQWGQEERIFTFTVHVEDDGSAWSQCDGFFVSVTSDEDAETLLMRGSEVVTQHVLQTTS